MVGTAVVNVSRWEHHVTFPTPYYRQRLAEAFGKTPVEPGLVPSTTFRVGNIPITRNPLFTSRALLLDLLHARLSMRGRRR